MDSHFETDNGYQPDTDAEHAMDEEGMESGIGEEQPDDYFNLAELEILAWRWREWMQARKKEKPIILWEIYKEFGKMEENRNLRPAEWQEKEEHITAWLKKPLRSQKPCITVRSAYKYSVHMYKRNKHIQEKQAHTRETSMYKRNKHVQEKQAHTRETSTYKRNKHVQEKQARTRETSTYKRNKHIQEKQAHTRETSTYKRNKHIQEKQTCTRETSTYKRNKHIQEKQAHTRETSTYKRNMHIQEKHAHTRETCTYKRNMHIQEKHALMKNESTSEGNNQQIDLYQQALTAFISEDLTKEELQAVHNITEKWNGPEGPTAEVQSVNRNVKKYGLKFMKNFAEEMWRYCGMRMVCLSGWKDGDGVVQACCDIAGGSTFTNIHTLNASWRDYLGTAYANSDVAEGEGVPNMAANRPRAKKSDPVELLTSEEGHIWIGDLIGHSHDSILQMLPSKGHSFPLKTTQKRSCHSEEIHSSVDEDADPDTEYEGTSFSPPHSYESIQTSNITGHSRKKIPMPHKVHHSQKHPMSPDGNSADEDGDPDIPYIPYEELCLTEALQDTSEHEDSDGFESVPFTDDHTANPGPLGQHQKNRQLKSALKQIPRAEQCSTSSPQPRKPKKQNREVSPRQQWAGSDDGHIALSAEEGGQWKSP
ncbi:hypothetical protein EDC04DRAFT_2605960 [Pisolithus marmoratus]|nr:hypothetical protein EDC04DRAFT_2605960 [Pisolithus marmoratus]